MRLHIIVGAVLSAVVLAAPGPAVAQEGVANNAKASQAQHAGIAAASPVADHAHLSDYFRDLASQEQALAESYARIATLYKEKVPLPGLDPATTDELRKQCRHLAETGRKAAAAATYMAAYHVRLAALTAHEPAPPKHTTPDESAYRK